MKDQRSYQRLVFFFTGSISSAEKQWSIDLDRNLSVILSQLDNELQQIKFAILQRVPQLDLSSILPIGDRIVKQALESTLGL